MKNQLPIFLSLWPVWLVVTLVIIDQNRLNFLYRFGAKREIIIKRALQTLLVLGLLGIMAVVTFTLWAKHNQAQTMKLIFHVLEFVVWLVDGPAPTQP